jgi:hypothetical protein
MNVNHNHRISETRSGIRISEWDLVSKIRFSVADFYKVGKTPKGNGLGIKKSPPHSTSQGTHSVPSSPTVPHSAYFVQVGGV